MTPMTQEQMDWVSEQVHRAANKAARRSRNQSLIGFLILLLGIGFVQWDGHHRSDAARDAIVQTGNVIAVDGCNRDYVSRKEIRAVLARSRDFQKGALDRGDISQTQYDLAVKFYDERLDTLPLPDCRKAANVLSSDPDKVPEVPEPLHP
jgi:hypothetical protein